MMENGRLIFTNDGDFLVATVEKKSVGLGMSTYEKKDKKTRTLQLSTPFGTVQTGYDCGYRFADKNHLVLMIEGIEVTFVKVREEEPKEYLEAAAM